MCFGCCIQNPKDKVIVAYIHFIKWKRCLLSAKQANTKLVTETFTDFVRLHEHRKIAKDVVFAAGTLLVLINRNERQF